jgi:hypothetical protein
LAAERSLPKWAEIAGSVERALGREIERDPAGRAGRQRSLCLLLPKAVTQEGSKGAMGHEPTWSFFKRATAKA